MNQYAMPAARRAVPTAAASMAALACGSIPLAARGLAKWAASGDGEDEAECHCGSARRSPATQTQSVALGTMLWAHRPRAGSGSTRCRGLGIAAMSAPPAAICSRIHCVKMCTWPLLAVLALATLRASALQLPHGFDPYAVLGLDPGAGAVEVRKAFRTLSLELHPDKVPASERQSAQEQYTLVVLGEWFSLRLRFRLPVRSSRNLQLDAARHPSCPPAQFCISRANAAYEVLGDEVQRQVFDSTGGQGFQDRQEWQQAGFERGFQGARGLFARGGPVREWAEHDVVLQSQEIRLVKFYAPWCIHCQELAPQLRRVALTLDGQAAVGAVNCEAFPGLCQAMEIHGYPTLRLMLPDGSTEEYHGPLSAEDIAAWALGVAADPVQSLSWHQLSSRLAGGLPRPLVLDFVVAGCGHFCAEFRHRLRDAAAESGGDVDFGRVDCDGPGAGICQQFRPTFFPFPCVLPTGARSLDDMVPLVRPDLSQSPAAAALAAFMTGVNANSRA